MKKIELIHNGVETTLNGVKISHLDNVVGVKDEIVRVPLKVLSRYVEPPNFEGFGWELRYRNNEWVWLGWDELFPSKFVEFEGNNEYFKGISLNIVDDIELIERYDNFVQSFRFEQKIKNLPIVDEFTVIDEANKEIWFNILDKVDGKYFYILSTYETTRGNTTLYLAPIKPIIEVPKPYIGIIIGKKGSNIKKVQEKYGCKISIIEKQ